MIAVALGLVAALCWAVHDLTARAFAARLGPFRLAFWVLVIGAVMLVPLIVWNGRIWHVPPDALLPTLLLGAFYAFAIASLLKAFSLAPVSIVGPLTAGYPALVVVWGLLHGLAPTLVQWMSLFAIFAGAVIVGRFGPDDGGFAQVPQGKGPAVIVSAMVAAVCFAASIIIGQQSALSIGELETTFASRLPAAALVFAFVRFAEPVAPRSRVATWKAVVIMGLCDVVAVTAINAAGYFPNKEMGAMAISCYGALSVLLAMIFLKEKVSAAQWLGIALICCGVAGLAIS